MILTKLVQQAPPESGFFVKGKQKLEISDTRTQSFGVPLDKCISIHGRQKVSNKDDKTGRTRYNDDQCETYKLMPIANKHLGRKQSENEYKCFRFDRPY
jgi:hypothetical protein